MGEPNAILAQAATVVADTLGANDLAIAEPVAARFRDAPHGSSGVAITVRLRDPARAAFALRVIADRFGGGAGVDVFTIT